VKNNKKINIKDLDGYIIYGNKVSAWDNTAHAFKDGNLCGKPSLADNFAKFQGIDEVGCKDCLKLLKQQEEFKNLFKVNEIQTKSITITISISENENIVDFMRRATYKILTNRYRANKLAEDMNITEAMLSRFLNGKNVSQEFFIKWFAFFFPKNK